MKKILLFISFIIIFSFPVLADNYTLNTGNIIYFDTSQTITYNGNVFIYNNTSLRNKQESSYPRGKIIIKGNLYIQAGSYLQCNELIVEGTIYKKDGSPYPHPTGYWCSSVSSKAFYGDNEPYESTWGGNLDWEHLPNNHTHQLETKKKGSCITLEICKLCGHTINTLEDHNWGEWIIDAPATVTTDGKRHRFCINDPTHKEEEILPAIECSHNHSHLLVNYTHSFDNYCFEEILQCLDCGYEKNMGKISHCFKEEIIEKPTCVKNKKKKKICSDCGVRKIFTISATGHSNLIWTIQKKATTKAVGIKIGKCPKCKKIVQTITIPKIKIFPLYYSRKNSKSYKIYWNKDPKYTYYIYRNDKLIKKSKTTGFIVSNIPPNKVYKYKIEAYSNNKKIAEGTKNIYIVTDNKGNIKKIYKK